MIIKNATPHIITFVDNDGNIIEQIKPCGQVARLGVRRRELKKINNIPVNVVENWEDESCFVPPEEENTIWICSKIFVDSLSDRNDLFFPDDTVRDENGRIVGCKALGQSG